MEGEEGKVEELEGGGVATSRGTKVTVDVGVVAGLGGQVGFRVVLRLASKVDVAVIVRQGIRGSKVDVGHGVTCGWSGGVCFFHSPAASGRRNRQVAQEMNELIHQLNK